MIYEEVRRHNDRGDDPQILEVTALGEPSRFGHRQEKRLVSFGRRELLHPRGSQRLHPRSQLDIIVPRISTHAIHRDLPRWRKSHHRRALEIRSNQFRPNEKPSPFPPSSPPVRPDSHDVVLESVCNSAPRSLLHFKRSPVTRHTHKRFVRPEPAKGRAKGGRGGKTWNSG